MTNKTFYMTGIEKLEVGDAPMPSIGPDDVLIKVQSVGVCGSDLHYYRAGAIGDYKVEYPFILGHEAAGVVAGVGQNVTTLKEGDRVCMEPGVPCMKCEECLSGHYNLCKDVRFWATPPYDGVLSEYVSHPAAFTFKIPDNMSFTEGALVEPLAIGLHACNMGGVKLGQTVVIMGAGCIGNYDSCSFNAQGQGTFKANAEAHPYVGEIGKVHFEDEVRIETVVPVHALNQVIAAMLKVHPYEEVAYDVFPMENEFQQAGAGMVGELENPMQELDFLNLVASTIGTPCLRHSALTGRKVQKVALCGGSGSPFMGDALRCGADAYLTADVKYHDFFVPEGRILLVDGGHFETEQFTKELIHDLIRKKFPTFAAVIAETETNSVHYFVKK